MTACLVGLAAVMALSLLRVPIAFAMGIVGFVGLGLVRSWPAAGVSVATIFHESGFQYTLSVVPLFVLMGNFVTRAGMADELFHAAQAVVGHRPGGLAKATVIACGGFGAICGSSVATAATLTRVAYPSMARYGFAPALATGAIAAGGTLGILIPPSVVMVLYGLMTETSIGALFAGGLVPGLLAILVLSAAIDVVARLRPASAPRAEPAPWPRRLAALRSVWAVLALFALVMGGIYGGAFTATEGAAIGSAGGLAFALARRSLDRATFASLLRESVVTTAMMFSILIGALIFANFVNFTSMGDDLLQVVRRFEVHPLGVVIAICAIYVLLGTAMEELSMIMLTVPVFFPLVKALGFDPVWFGVLIVVVVQIGLISPPVGMNIFVIHSRLPEVPTGTIFRGVVPFNVALVALLALLLAFPAIVTWLPQRLGL